MAYWLLKTEPSEYGWNELERDGRTVWDGVRSPAALQQARQIEPGDELLVYHTGTERAVVGVARAASGPYPSPGDARLVVFDVEPLRKLLRPVPLAEIKADPELGDTLLVRVPRLSIVPLTPAQRRAILAKAEVRGPGGPGYT